MNKKSIFRILSTAFILAVLCTATLYAQDIAVFPQMGHTSMVESVVFSPDGKFILSGSGDNTVKLWEAATGRVIRTFSSHSDSVKSVAFSPDGRQILSGSSDKTTKLWDAATGREIRTFSGHFAGISISLEFVTFSPDGTQAISANSYIQLWDVATGMEIRTFTGNTGLVRSVAFSPDGKQVLSGSYDNTVRLWDTTTGRVIRTFTGHTSEVNSVAFSPDGRQILSGSADKTMKLWDTATGREIRTSGHAGKVHSVAFSPDGKQIISGSGDYHSKDNTVRLWDTATGREIRTFTGHTNDVLSVAFSPDGKQIISCSLDSTIKLWDATMGKELRTFGGQVSSVRSVAFSPDGKQALAGGWGVNNVKLWDLTTGRVSRTFGNGFYSATVSVVFSPDGSQAISAGSGSIKLLDVATGREIRTFSGHTREFRSAAFSPDGKQVLSGSGDYHSKDYTVRLWDAAKGREIRTFTGHTSYVESVAFSSDGKQVLSGSSDSTIKLWDAKKGKEIRTFTGHKGGVHSVAFSPDGKYILSSSYDKTVKLWDAATAKEIKTFTHTSAVTSAVFSPDGKYILAGSHDGVKLWDAATGEEIKTFTGYINNVNSVAFSPDGKQALLGSMDGSVSFWDLSTGKEMASFISFSGNDTQLASATRGLTVETQTAATTSDGEWLTITPEGYYQASPRGDRYLNVRVNNTVSGIDSYRSVFYNPDVVLARLQGRPDPASKANVTIQQAASFTPPTVTIQSPANYSTTSTATVNLSVAVVDQNQPIKNIKILVNGRLVGPNELAGVKGSNLQPQKASLTVTGNQKTVNFTLPLNLDPGPNIIEVVAFNGYSENQRLPVEVTFNAPAGQRPALPNLWILAVGVNNYQEKSISNLNFCVADAKGVVSSLKAQEGRRYAKVNSLLIADGEALAPTADNIRKNLSFLDQAGERDVVLLFLAGHGVSDNAGKFLFLPGDTRYNANNSINEATTITDADIVKLLDRAGNLLVFIDACNSGGVDSDRLVRSLMDTNAFVFTASRGTEYSYEDPKLGHGFFTYGVMEGLKGPVAAQAQGNVTVLSLSGFVSQDVPKRTDGKQNPKAYSLGFYDFPMAVVK